MNDVFICDGIRTPFGRYRGALSTARADDLAALPIKAGEMELMIAGDVESMSRAPFVMGKAKSAFSRIAMIVERV